jgi:glucosamine-phosphate N-acetyltransferase
MRPLAKTDLSRGHLSVLSILTSAPEVSETRYAQAFDEMQFFKNYFTLVIVSRATDRIVGAGTVFLEQKFIRSLGKVGHIEDIVVDKSMQGRKLGLRIITALTVISEAKGCYKTILNCSEDNARKYCPHFTSLSFCSSFFVLRVCSLQC